MKINKCALFRRPCLSGYLTRISMRISLYNVDINAENCYQSKWNQQADLPTRDIPYYSVTGI